MRVWSLLSLFLLTSCGNAQIIAPTPLSVVDTDPGNGSLVLANRNDLVVVFSESIVVATLDNAVALEQTTNTGVPIRELSVSFNSFDNSSLSATFNAEPFPAGSSFRLTIKKEGPTALSGAKLQADFIRHFRTTS